MINNFDIEKFLSLEGYYNDIRKSRRKNSEVIKQAIILITDKNPKSGEQLKQQNKKIGARKKTIE